MRETTIKRIYITQEDIRKAFKIEGEIHSAFYFNSTEELEITLK